MNSATLPTDTLPAVPPRRSRRKWIIIALLILSPPVLAAAWFFHRGLERTRVLTAIEAAGGKYHPPPDGQRFGYLISRLLGAPAGPVGYGILLKGQKIDDAWLAEQHDLRSLPVIELLITDTRLTREAAMRLATRNELITFNVTGVPLTDADAAVIGQLDRLTHLNIQQSAITDAGLAALNPARLFALDVSGTPITSAALQQQLTGASLQYLGVGGRQFTPELATQLAGMTTLGMLRLAGPDVTDTHVELLKATPALRYITIDETSVSPAAIEALKAANPQAQVEVFDPETAFFKWRKAE